ncbi:MAG: hypothetical protein EOP50_02535 [Sphingobacteriales bacterium]|nr:MAG: hypothetical protein EOP50_02535 [Sphingobacteriales bacterium]
MAAKKYNFQQFKEDTLNATCVAWRDDAAKGLAFPPDIEQRLQWAQTHTKMVDGDSVAYGIFEVGDDVATGICEVALTRPGTRSAWVKMLSLHIRPALEVKLLQRDLESIEAALIVFSSAVHGSIKLKFEHKALTLKVYGRSNDQLDFLRALALHLKPVLKNNAKCSIEGRWLAIKAP